MPYTYEYPRPAVTVDVVMFTMQAEGLAILLIRRKHAPFKGAWALPGGFVNENESLLDAAGRELEEETAVRGATMEQLGAFGDPGRDPRGHTVSVAFLTFVVAASHPVNAGDDAAEVAWVPLRDLPVHDANDAPPARPRRPSSRPPAKTLAFDHARIIEIARLRLQDHLTDPTRTAPFEIVPQRFTLTELQRVHEAVLGRALDKRNFRAKITAHGLVEPVAAQQRVGRHRPAQLYRWKRPTPKRTRDKTG